MNVMRLKTERRLYNFWCFLMQKFQKPIWKYHKAGYLTFFYDYEGKYAYPEKEEASHFGVNNILSLERAYGIKSTFFVVGRLFYDYPEVIKKMIQDGHDIASHTYDHCIIRKSQKREIKEDIQSTIRVFRQFGLSLEGMRCPQGKWNFVQLKAMSENGLRWSAERDEARFPYIIYKKNMEKIVRFPIRMTDHKSFYKNYNPERMYSQLVSAVQKIRKNKIYGAIGFHPWLIGEDETRIQVLSDFFNYVKKLDGLEIITFNEAYKLIGSDI